MEKEANEAPEEKEKEDEVQVEVEISHSVLCARVDIDVIKIFFVPRLSYCSGLQRQ